MYEIEDDWLLHSTLIEPVFPSASFDQSPFHRLSPSHLSFFIDHVFASPLRGTVLWEKHKVLIFGSLFEPVFSPFWPFVLFWPGTFTFFFFCCAMSRKPISLPPRSFKGQPKNVGSFFFLLFFAPWYRPAVFPLNQSLPPVLHSDTSPPSLVCRAFLDRSSDKAF